MKEMSNKENKEKSRNKSLTWLIIALLVVAIVVIVLTTRNNDDTDDITESESYEPKLAWGIEIDSLLVDSLIINQNQNLSDILTKKGVSASKIDRLVRNAKDIFDVRRIRSGNNCFVLCDSIYNEPQFFVYEENPVNFIVFDLSDSLNVYRGAKNVDTQIRTVSGVIKTSLWNALVDQNVSPVLAIEMSDIYAWTIDFFGIQKGDMFKAVYEEKYVEGKFYGLGKIYAAYFQNCGQGFSAYYFDENDQEGYFDNEGNSLRKAFLKAPLNYSRISSHFSNSRMHPVLKIRRPHHGVDYAAPSGTPVVSIGDGVVVKKAYQAGGGGNYLTIKHNSVYTTQYMHLKGYAQGIAAGTRVKQGQLIGYVGMTGLASGPHLDFRVFKNGTPIDPLKMEAPPVEPISKINEPLFMSLRDSLTGILDTIKVAQLQNALTVEQ